MNDTYPSLTTVSKRESKKKKSKTFAKRQAGGKGEMGHSGEMEVEG